MRVLPFLLALVMVLAGCAQQRGGSEPTGTTGPEAPPSNVVVFSGLAPFGENNTALVGERVPAVFGVANFTYVSGYGPEPNIGITSSGAIFTSAFSSVMRSTDGGATWSVVHTHQPSDLNNDPMLWVDPWTDIVYNAPMAPTLLCAMVYPSTDDGATWGTAAPVCGTSPFDHQKLASGPAGPGENPLASLGLHPTVLYMCYNGIAVTNCAASYDGGVSWPVNRPTIVNTAQTVLELAGALPEGGIDGTSPCFSGQNGHPTVSPGGMVAFLRTWSCTQPILTYSTDSGVSWTNIPGPQFPGGPSDFLTTANAHSIDPEVAFTPDGTMYVLFQSHNHHAYVARSPDQGVTWEGPWDVTPPGTSSTVFAALGAGDDGRIAMAFLAAANVTGSSAQAPATSRWHLYIVTSHDANAVDPTFVAYRATPESDPVQVGPILQGGGTDNTRNLLDFIDGAVAPNGDFYVSYTEGCTKANGCADKPVAEQTDGFRGSEGAVAWLKGANLLAAPRTGPVPL